MRCLLDSNVILDAILGRSEALLARFDACFEGDLVTSAVAYGELAHGSVHGKPPPLDVLQAFLDHVPVLPFEMAAAQAYANLPFVRGSYDQLIAAHALSLNVILVTNNERDFLGIAGLRVENWMKQCAPPSLPC